ncbi:MAG: TMEM165/GDT1 family protein [Gammaproteobacteria bacterium]|nr:TMEM165/GDT1 family protein [Gammaproteobacteria bacterium]
MEDLSNLFSSISWPEIISISGSSYLLIFAAEIGDKSQIVCMTLAARYRAFPVILGAVLAFILLNTLAVTFGVTIASWVPEVYISAIVTILFAVFGLHALRIEEESEEDSVKVASNRSLLIATFLLISVAEFGDKTQLAVVALSSTNLPAAIWLGSTLALVTTSVLGVWAGRTLLQRMPITLLHRISGLIFIAFAIFSAYKTYIAL